MKNAMINTYNLIRRMISLTCLGGVGWIVYKISVPVYALFMTAGSNDSGSLILGGVASTIVLAGLVGIACLMVISKIVWVNLDKDVE